MPSPVSAYQQAIDKIMAQFHKAENEALRQIIGQLKELRKDIADTITSTDNLQGIRIQGSIDAAIADFERESQRILEEGFTKAYGLGEDMINAPLLAVGLTPPPLNQELLGTLLGFSADLIKDITADMRQQINRQLRLAALGGQTPFQIMKEITNILGIKARDGIWGTRRRPEIVKGVAARAEAIVRTELTRVYNIAHMQAAKQVGIQGLQKRWIATGDRRTRRTHLRAHIDTEAQPIPINQPFQVGRYSMMYPGDPMAGAEETVNCRCVMITVVPEIGSMPSELDRQVKKQLR
jgi:hypothetical protein